MLGLDFAEMLIPKGLRAQFIQRWHFVNLRVPKVRREVVENNTYILESC